MGSQQSRPEVTKPPPVWQRFKRLSVSRSSSTQTPEVQALYRHRKAVISTVTDPLVFSHELYARRIIEADARDRANLSNLSVSKRNGILMSEVIDSVERTPSLFQYFVRLLKEDKNDALKSLGVKLETTYNDNIAELEAASQSASSSSSMESEHLPSIPAEQSPPASEQVEHAPPAGNNVERPPRRQRSYIPPPRPPPLTLYGNYLRAYYQTAELPVNNKWPPTSGRKFFHLEIISREGDGCMDVGHSASATRNIDAIVEARIPLEIGDIFRFDSSIVQCIVIEGSPGIGKTTLAWEICKRWGKELLLQQFSIVLLMRLKDPTLQKATTVADIIIYQYQQDEVAEKLIESEGRNMLIIFEGIDELPEHLLTQPSIFSRILSGEEFPFASLLITSTPHARIYLQKGWKRRVTQHIEILGFRKKSTDKYAVSALPTKEVPGFHDYLTINPHMKTVLYNTLYTAVVAEIFRVCQDSKRPLPTSITQLYTYLVQTLLLRYLDSHPLYREDKQDVNQFTDLPPPVYKCFHHVAELAYTGAMEQQPIVERLYEAIDHVNFLETVMVLSPDKQSVSYSHNFLHYSMREYLATYYVSRMETHEQEQLLEKICTEPHLKKMGQFLAGMTQFKDLNKAVVTNAVRAECILAHKEDEEEQEKGEDDNSIPLSAYSLQLLYEAEDASFLNEFQRCRCTLTNDSPLWDFSTLGFCITRSNCKWRLQLGGVDKPMQSTERIELLVEELKGHSNPEYSIESLECHYDTPECLENILSGLPTNALPQELKIVSAFKPLPQSVPNLITTMTSLYSLRLENVTGAAVMLKTLQAVVTLKSLKELILYYSETNGKCVTTLCKWLSTCSPLEKLAIPLPSPKTVEDVAAALTKNSTLKSLDLWGSQFNSKAMRAFASMLSHNNTLTAVHLEYCRIDNDSIKLLAENLSENDTLTTLDLDHNPINSTAAFEALSSNSKLTALNVGESGDNGVIAKQQTSNGRLTTPYIVHNSFCDQGCKHTNNTLTSLEVTST